MAKEAVDCSNRPWRFAKPETEFERPSSYQKEEPIGPQPRQGFGVPVPKFVPPLSKGPRSFGSKGDVPQRSMEPIPNGTQGS